MEKPARSPLITHLPTAAFLLCMAAELLSFLTYLHPLLRQPALVLLGIGAFVLAATDLRRLFLVVAAEAVIGSHGRLFFAEFGGFSVSIRMILFALLTLGWAVHAARGCSRILHFRHAHVTGPLLLLLAAVTLAAVRGWSEGSSLRAVFDDANAYAYILLVPVALDLFADRASYATLLRVLSGAVAWLAAKSLLLLYLFSHDFSYFLTDLYRWQRTYGLSEMTRLGGGAVRIFAASDLFLVPAVFLGALLAWREGGRRKFLWTALAAAAFLLSLSRSFWLGSAMAAAFMLPVFVRIGIVPLEKLGSLFRTSALAVLLGAAALAALVLVPYPSRLQDAGALGTYGGRFLDVSDAAVSSRWHMLAPLREAIAQAPVLGSGFGATVTYQSDDPRMHDLFPGGRVTTGAIEWQYLEIWLKMGVLGLVAVFWLFWRIGLFFWRTIKAARDGDRLLAAGLMLSFLAFVAADVFTPYVNHPLGWIFLTLVVTGLHAMQEHAPPPHHRTPSAASFR